MLNLILSTDSLTTNGRITTDSYFLEGTLSLGWRFEVVEQGVVRSAVWLINRIEIMREATQKVLGCVIFFVPGHGLNSLPRGRVSHTVSELLTTQNFLHYNL